MELYVQLAAADDVELSGTGHVDVVVDLSIPSLIT